jgi:NADH-quinone oxidoreductase subunit N
MLAYSSVAHTGYAMVGLAAAQGLGRAGGVEPPPAFARVLDGAGPSAAVFYAVAYLVMTLAAFVFLIFAGKREGVEAETYDELAGLAKHRPWAAAFMAILMFSLAGIPPTAGFIGKFGLFKAAVDAGHVALAILGVVTSAVGVYYYLRVVVVMYMHEAAVEEAVPGPDGEDRRARWSPGIAVSMGAALTMLLGLFPQAWMDRIRMAVEDLLR